LEAFASIGSDLDAETQKTIDLGRRITEVLKQPQYSPMALENQVVIMYAVNNGFFNSIPVEKMAETESSFHQFMATQGKEVLDAIRTSKELNEDTEAKLKKAIENFVQSIK
jgi:F0F1-type ATP synthase alpha subunit